MTKCVYRLEDGSFCTKHSNAFYDTDCEEDRGIPCEDKKVLTNYDRLRLKSLEEMAEFMLKGCDNIKQEVCLTEKACDECWLNWLRSPAEEGET